MRIVPSRLAPVLALVALAAPSRGQASLAERAPSDTLLYLSIDAARLVEGSLDLELAKLLDETQVREFLAPLAAHAPVELSTRGLRQLIDSVPWRSYVDGRVELALRGFEVAVGEQRLSLAPSQPLDARTLNRLGSFVDAVQSGRASSISIEPDVVLSIDVGDRFGGWYDEMLQGLERSSPGTHSGGVTSGGVTSTSCRIAGRDASRLTFQPDRDGPAMSIHLLADQGRWWVAGSAASLERTLAGVRGDCLARDAAFRRCVDQVATTEPAVLGYLNVAHIARMFERLVPPIVQEELDLLGLSAIESVGLASSFVEGGVRDSVAISWSRPPGGLLSLLDCVDGGFDYLQVAPAETGLYVGLRIAPEALFDKLARVVDEIAPGTGRGLDVALAEIEKQSGMDVRDTLLPAFGDEVGLWVTAPTGGAMLPDGMVMVEVGDHDQFAELFAMLRDQSAQRGVQWNAARGLPEGVQGFTLVLPDAPVQPAIALTRSALCVAPSVLSLKSGLKAAEGGRPASALDNERLRRVLTGLTGQPSAAGLSLLAFIDLQQLAAVGYQFAPMAAAPMQEMGLDASALPDAETVTRHFSGIGIAGRSDGRGMTLSFFTPTGLVPAVGLGVARQFVARAHAMTSVEPAPTAAAPVATTRAAAPVKEAKEQPSSAMRTLAQLFANLEKATGVTIDYPVALGDVQVSYHAQSADIDVILGELSGLVGFSYSIEEVDGDRLVTITRS